MSYLEQAIRDAVENGWRAKFSPNGIKMNSRNWHPLMVTAGEFYQAWLLDPAFWESLGVARGWHDCGVKDCGACASALVSKNWMWRWHSFINHLIMGGDIESFFKSISSNK